MIRALFTMLAILPSMALAQTSTGAIGGTVIDGSGAIMPAVHVTARNMGTGDKRTTTTNELGVFLFPALPPGAYEVAAEREGFKRVVRSDIALSVQDSIRLELAMAVGSISERVEVTGELPLLATATSSLGQVVDNKKIVDIPLNGRNTLALVTLTAGVQPLGNFGGVTATGNAYASGNYSVSGSRGLSSEVIIDGAPANASLFTAPIIVPSVDAVEEFKVQTSTYSAEFGRSAGGVVNVVMKSGTNSFHGNLYEFFRNRVLDGNGYTNNMYGRRSPVYIYNMFGGTLGGPVKIPKIYDGKDRTFFFTSYEGFRQRSGITNIYTLPTMEERAGDFSQTFTSAGQPVVIYDALTTRLADNGAYTREAFPGNRIPQNRIDKVGAKLMTYFPTPNLPGDRYTHVRNFISSGGATNLSDQVNVRIDHQISPANRLFGRYSLNEARRGAANLFGNAFGGVNPSGGNVPLTMNGYQFVLRDSITASPNTLIDFSYGGVFQRVDKVPLSWGSPLTDLDFSPQLDAQMHEKYYPNFGFSNYTGLTGSNGDLIARTDYTHTVQGTVTKLLTRHSIKAGGEYRLIRANDFQPPTMLSFSFSQNWTTQNPRTASATAGNAIASALLGYSAGGTYNMGPSMALQNHYAGIFVQDDVRVTQRLTLNLGFRYEIETPRTERYNRTNWFDYDAPNPLASKTGITNLHGGLVFAGVDGNSRRQQVLDRNNFAGRIGFAYTVNSKLVLRGGYGVFYMPLTGTGIGSDLSSAGFAASTTMITSRDSNLTPADILSNPFPAGVGRPRGSADGLTTMTGQSFTSIDANNPVGYTQQFGANLQYQLPGSVLVDVAYSGSHAVKIPAFYNENSLDPVHYSYQGGLYDRLPNPFLGLVSLGTFTNTTLGRDQLLRPFPQFTGVNLLKAIGNSNYNSLQLKVERRFASGLGFLTAYTFAKNLGDVNPMVTWLGDAAVGVQNNYNRSAERSLLTFDRSQRLVASYSYELPIGRGKYLGNGWNKWVDLIAGGWQINGTTILENGTPLIMGLNQANAYGGSRPNSTGQSAKLSSSERSLDRWFNTSVFTQPPAYSFGNVSRTLPDVRNPGSAVTNLSLFKYFGIREGLRAQFRLEAFNAFNRTSLGWPSTSLGGPSFGRITSWGGPRNVQLALKLNF